MLPKLTTAALCLLFAHSGIAQVNEMGSNANMNEPGNRYLNYRTKYDDIGSPFFLNEYQDAELTATDGKVYRNVKVKVNLENNEVMFLSEGREMVTTLAVTRVRFLNPAGAQGTNEKMLVSIGDKALNAPNAPICQVLATGHCSLLKQIRVTHEDKREQQKAAITRKFMQVETYYLVMENGSTEKLKPGKDDLVNLLRDKAAVISGFIDQNQLKCRSEEDYIKVLQYYNSLFQSAIIKTAQALPPKRFFYA